VSGCGSIRARSPRSGGFFDQFVSAESSQRRVNRGDRRPSQVSLERATADWIWPLKKVELTSHFGRRKGGFHEGIDLRARVGTLVRAVQKGRVVFVGTVSGYGKLVVLRHESELFSVYAHNSKILVQEGQLVRQGQQISRSGKTGRASGPHLHFEVRHREVALDPLPLFRRARSQLALK
jgi:murein DD-endopeptidase MepM/ murein hydrolase activator NlpD